MALTEAEKQALLNNFTGTVLSGEETWPKKKHNGGTFKDEEGSRLPVTHKKSAGQPTSKTGFPKGRVGAGGAWLPE